MRDNCLLSKKSKTDLGHHKHKKNDLIIYLNTFVV